MFWHETIDVAAISPGSMDRMMQSGWGEQAALPRPPRCHLMSLEPRKVWRALVQERGPRLVELRTAEALEEDGCFLLDPLGDPGLIVLQQPFRKPNRPGRQRPYMRRQFVGNAHESIVVNDAIDQTPSQRCLRVDRLAEKHQLSGPQMPDGARQQPRAGSFRNQAKVDERHRQPGAPSGDDKIAMQQQGRP